MNIQMKATVVKMKKNKYVICLDAGHGGKDPGAVNGKRFEKDDVLKLVKRVGKILEANGVSVCYTRQKDIFMSPSEKAKHGNALKPDYFVSIHRNAAINKKATGAEVYVYSQGNDTKTVMAKNIQKNLVKVGFSNRGIKNKKLLTVLSKTTMPAMLLEVGFISNTEDNNLFDEKFYSIANAIARGIIEALGYEFKTITELKG